MPKFLVEDDVTGAKYEFEGDREPTQTEIEGYVYGTITAHRPTKVEQAIKTVSSFTEKGKEVLKTAWDYWKEPVESSFEWEQDLPKPSRAEDTLRVMANFFLLGQTGYEGVKSLVSSPHFQYLWSKIAYRPEFRAIPKDTLFSAMRKLTSLEGDVGQLTPEEETVWKQAGRQMGNLVQAIKRGGFESVVPRFGKTPTVAPTTFTPAPQEKLFLSAAKDLVKFTQALEKPITTPLLPVITTPLQLEYKGVPPSIVKDLPNEVIPPPTEEWIQKTLPRFPQKVVDQKSLEEVGNAMAKEMGIQAKINWEFKLYDKKYVSGETGRYPSGNFPHEIVIRVPKGKLSRVDVMEQLESKEKIVGGVKVGRLSSELQPTQGKIKKIIAHELSHILTPGEKHNTIFWDEVDYHEAVTLIKREMRKKGVALSEVKPQDKLGTPIIQTEHYAGYKVPKGVLVYDSYGEPITTFEDQTAATRWIKSAEADEKQKLVSKEKPDVRAGLEPKATLQPAEEQWISFDLLNSKGETVQSGVRKVSTEELEKIKVNPRITIKSISAQEPLKPKPVSVSEGGLEGKYKTFYGLDPENEVDKQIIDNASDIEDIIKAQEKKGQITIPVSTGMEEGTLSKRVRDVLYHSRERGADVWAAIRDLPSRIYHAFDTFKFESTLKEFPQAKNDIRTRLLPIGDKATRKSTILMHGLFGDLSKYETNQVLDIAYLRNFLAREKQGLTLPQGITKEEIESSLNELLKTTSDKVKGRVDKIFKINNAIRKDLVRRGLLSEESGFEEYVPHFVEAYVPGWLERMRGHIGKRLRQPYRSYTKAAVGSMKDLLISKEALAHHYASIFTDNMIDNFAEEFIPKYSVGVPSSIKEPVKAGKVYNVEGKEYKGFQYIPGRSIFRTQVINPNLIQKGIDSGWTDAEWQSHVRTILQIGKQHPVKLLPRVIAERLEELKQPTPNLPGLHMAGRFTTLWKRITLDLAGAPYQLGNLFGDSYALFLASPQAFGKIPEAFHLLTTSYDKLNDTQKAKVDFLVEHQVPGSGFVAEYLHLGGKGIPGVKQYEQISYYREALLRSTMGVYQYDRVTHGLPIKAPGIDVKGLDLISAAGKVAREFGVDFGASSLMYKGFLSRLVTPFLKFYTGITSITANYIKADPTGALLKIALPFILAYAWNRMGKRKEVEDKLPEYLQESFHINLSSWDVNKDGKSDKALVWRMTFAPEIALSWTGLNKLPSKVDLLRRGILTPKEAARQQLFEMGAATPEMLNKLSNPVIKVFEGLLANKNPFTGIPIVPERLKGTEEGNNLNAQFFVESFNTSLVHLSNAYRGSEPIVGNPILDWLVNGPLDMKRALGFYTVDLTGYSARVMIKESEKLEAIRNQYLYEIEQRYIKGLPFRDIQEKAKDEGIRIGGEEIVNRKNSPRVQTEKLKLKMRQTTDPVERLNLDREIIRLRQRSLSEMRKLQPRSIRRQLRKELQPAGVR